MSKSKALVAIRAKLAQAAENYSSEEESSSTFIALRGGILQIGEEPLPGNEMLVIVLDAIHENTYFPDKFDPEVILPPKCFSFGRSLKELQPHENIPEPGTDAAEDSYFELQADWCDECPHGEWGSADTGKGKACGQRRRLAVIPAGIFTQKGRRDTEMEVFDDPEHFRDADIAFMKLPVTSVKAWSKYVRRLSNDHNVPPFAVLTHVYIEPDPKVQFRVCFDLIEVVEDEDILNVLIARNEEARQVIEQPYTEPDMEQTETPKNKARSGLKGVKKKKRR